jgi:16S rRNA processing protein RimM
MMHHQLTVAAVAAAVSAVFLLPIISYAFTATTFSTRRRAFTISSLPAKPKKKNKYANFSKTDNLSLDPFEAMLSESRDKLKELHEEKSTKHKRNKKRQEITSLEAIDELLASDVRDITDEENEDGITMEEKRERNKRSFPDTQTIDPYDPTTYGYIELGTIIGAHGVHGWMKLTSTTDFGEHRLCEPGIRHIKPANRRSPREVELVEGRPLRSETATTGTDTKPMYLIRLANVEDREEALKMRGYVLYSLAEEKVDDYLEEDEYIVSDLVGLNVFLDESCSDQRSGSFEDLFVGNIRGVVLGSEMCAIPGLGQDLLEIALPSSHGGQSEDLVLVPFVPEIVSNVDLDGKMVMITPPNGLLDLSYRREEKVRIKGLLPASISTR